MPPKRCTRSSENAATTPTKRGRRRSGAITPEQKKQINKRAKKEMKAREALFQEEEREKRNQKGMPTMEAGKEADLWYHMKVIHEIAEKHRD